MEPHSPYPPNYFPHQPGQVQVPPLPAWARTFRTILLILAGVLVVLLLLLIAVGTGSIDMYTEDGLGALQAVIWLCLGMLLLAIPYVIASVIYAALWATKLRGRGYRRHLGTAWILVAGPILAALPALALIGLITADPSML